MEQELYVSIWSDGGYAILQRVDGPRYLRFEKNGQEIVAATDFVLLICLLLGDNSPEPRTFDWPVAKRPKATP